MVSREQLQLTDVIFSRSCPTQISCIGVSRDEKATRNSVNCHPGHKGKGCLTREKHSMFSTFIKPLPCTFPLYLRATKTTTTTTKSKTKTESQTRVCHDSHLIQYSYTKKTFTFDCMSKWPWISHILHIWFILLTKNSHPRPRWSI